MGIVLAMSRWWRALIALLCSIMAMPIGYVLGFYLLLAVDPHYHDGVSFTGGLVSAGIASLVTFRGVMMKTVPAKSRDLPPNPVG